MGNESQNQKLKILWALDPTTKGEGLISHMAHQLKTISGGSGVEIYPVYILSPLPLINLGETETTQVFESWKSNADTLLVKVLKKIKLPGMMKPEVLIERSGTLSGSARILDDKAKDVNADLIALCTHGRSGVNRAILGSFAETLILHSHVPLFVIPPHSKKKLKIKKILFPTDFSDASKKSFEKICAMASAFKGEILIHNHVRHPVEAALQSSVLLMGGGWVSFEDYSSAATEAAKSKMTTLEDIAHGKGIKTRSFVTEGSATSSESILKIAKKEDVDLIAMVSNRSALGATFIGSVTRQIFRTSPVPVLGLHSRSL